MNPTPPLQLILAVHNHQPVGNFGSVFAEAYDRCYRPFLDEVSRHPSVRLALHYSGPLLEWIERERPAFLKDLKALVERGQVEILGGGFYEPMLAVLPDADARGQIRQMQEFCATHFGRRPVGMWLAERVWDPDLPRVIAPTGIRFTLLDDDHLFAAGVPEQRLLGHYLTDKAGSLLSIFPIDKKLRYQIPFALAPVLFDSLEQLARELPTREGAAARCLTYGDDGEKFGLWPGTHDWVYGKGWLREFFEGLALRGEWLRTVHPSAILAGSPPEARIYLPTASYHEMGEWTLPAVSMARYDELEQKLGHEGLLERYRPFVRGGIWQGFFAKYPESNQLQQRMLAVSRRLAADEARGLDVAEARTHLYRSQCNCAYWHGLFGGLYLNFLRHANLEDRLTAESLLGRAEDGDRPRLRVEVADLDADLADEVAVENQVIGVLIDPGDGGSLAELNYLPKAYALGDVLARREEGYHQKLRELDASQASGGPGTAAPASIHDLTRAKEPGLSRLLVTDGYRRASFIDRCHAPEHTLDALKAGADGDCSTLARQAYQLLALRREPGTGELESIEVPFRADGRVTLAEAERPLRIEKRYRFARREPGCQVDYRLSNPGDRPLDFIFAPELNLTLLAGDAPDRTLDLPGGRRERMNFRGVVPSLEKLAVTDGWAGFSLKLSARQPFELWCYPVETVSQSEAGFERTYQGTCLLLRSALSLAPGGEAELAFRLAFQPV
jgi:alpha-amylase